MELRIFEGDAKNDITFSYHANFFLFATLELARPIMHGRVQPQSQQIPVLTGMPVSGMAYLDRPSEAGYFIFPDLSVRHEGKYRLSFNLYEETKDVKDFDAEPSTESQHSPSPPCAAATEGSFDWRLEVKSAPFTVYSAKKFPGLTESTILSRTVAEQGCRVRIRRDVRMRRREGKNSGDYDDEYDDARVRRTATPESVHDAYVRQSRSVSHSPTRGPAGSEYPQHPYSSYAPSPATPQSAPPGGYLSFGNSSSQFNQLAPPYAQSAPPPPPPLQAQQSYQPAQPPYHPPPSYRQPSAPANYGYSNPYPPRDNYESDYRRPTANYPPAPPPTGSQYPPADQTYNRTQSIPSYPQYPPRAHTPGIQPVSLAPLKMPALEPKYENISSPAGPLQRPSHLAPPLPSPSYHDRPKSFNHYPKPDPGPAPIVPELGRTGKRTFDSVFSASSLTQPLHNGMRPSSSHYSQDPNTAIEEDEDSISMEALRMQYRRADGSSYSRELPLLE